MPLLEINTLSLSIGSTLLFNSFTARLNEGDRVGLVGRNGSGKSTFLRFLAGLQSESKSLNCEAISLGAGNVSGTLTLESGTPETLVLLVAQDRLLWSELFPNIGCGEEELLESTLPDVLDMAAAAVEGDMDAAESWRALSVAASDLLGWRTAKYESTPLGKLSLGCAARCYLAVALLRPEVRLLLLDEPTNHLDLPSIVWLQRMLTRSNKAVVVVSHDESFLDAVANHVWFIDADLQEVKVSAVQYSAFIHARRAAREQQRRAYEEQEEHRRRLKTAADRLRDASTAGSRHQGRDHDILQRDFKRDRAGRSGQKAKALERRSADAPITEPPREAVPLRIRLRPVSAGFDSSLMLDSVKLGYDMVSQLPLPPVSLRIDYGERIAIVGPNGIGKSALLRTIWGELPPLEGAVSTGRELRVGKLTQEHTSLVRDVTPRSQLAAMVAADADFIDPFCAGSMLLGYGLKRTQIDKPIAALNPGGRVRLLFAGYAARQVNALLLDEPTNHLDDEAVDVLTSSLNDYSGSLLVVSHDCSFLRALRDLRLFSLSSDGLEELKSLDDYVSDIEQAVDIVISKSLFFS